MSICADDQEQSSSHGQQGKVLDFNVGAATAKPKTRGSAKGVSTSDTMAMAIACLGGRKHWEGSVRGFFGLLRRTTVIESSGAIEDGVLVFRETLTFDNGDEEKREWRLRDEPEGLMLKADGIQQLRPGRIEGGLLVVDYILSLNGMKFGYRDSFKSTPDGGVKNTGRAKLLGVPVMTINVTGQAL